VDWTGLMVERVARWYRQVHIFLYPFYYIEYGVAQLGALQVFRNQRVTERPRSARTADSWRWVQPARSPSCTGRPGRR
jgi:oligoendopeptidase F